MGGSELKSRNGDGQEGHGAPPAARPDGLGGGRSGGVKATAQAQGEARGKRV